MYKSNLQSRKARAGRQEKKREVVYPEEGQEFAYVQEMLGNGRLKAYCEDGMVRVGRIRGSMRKYRQKVIINNGDVILVSRRDYEEDKVDVIHKYSLEEANQLHYQGEFPEKIAKMYQTKDDMYSIRSTEDDTYVVFANASAAASAAPGSGTDDEGSSADEAPSPSLKPMPEEELDIDAI